MIKNILNKTTKFLKNKKFLFAFIFFLALTTFSVGFPSLTAQSRTVVVTPHITPITDPENIEEAADSIIGRLETLVAGFAIIMLIISGIIYIFSQGNDERTTLAKKIMTATIIGLVIILASRTLIKETYNVFGPQLGAEELPEDITRSQEIFEIIQRFLSVLLSVLAILGIISLVWGGMIYLVSAGDENRIEKGKKQVIYSIIGIAISVGAMIIINQVESLFQ